jgi:DNA-binding transcriptional LysR family regulator
MEGVDRIGRRLKLRELHILLAVVERGSMAKAAAELAISQPAVSKAIADMEVALGLRLLDRGRSGIEPTAYGRVLVKRGIAVFDELKQGVEELKFLSDPTTGELRIGSQESIAAGLLPAVIDRFSRQYPAVRLTVAQALFGTLHYRELRERRIDLLLGRIPQPFAEGDLDAHVMFDDQLAVIAGKHSQWARPRKLALADLVDASWILPPLDTMAGVQNADMFHACGLERPQALLTTLSIHLCCSLVASGRFITALPSSIFRFGRRDLPLKVLPVKLPYQSRPVAFLTLKGRTLTPVAKLFIECTRSVVKPMIKRTD